MVENFRIDGIFSCSEICEIAAFLPLTVLDVRKLIRIVGDANSGHTHEGPVLHRCHSSSPVSPALRPRSALVLTLSFLAADTHCTHCNSGIVESAA